MKLDMPGIAENRTSQSIKIECFAKSLFVITKSQQVIRLLSPENTEERFSPPRLNFTATVPPYYTGGTFFISEAYGRCRAPCPRSP